MQRKITISRGQGLVLAALIACLTGCEQNTQSPEASLAPARDGTGAAMDANEVRAVDPTPVQDAALRDLLFKDMKATQKEAVFLPQGSALAKTAAQTCLINFDNVSSLSAMADHAYAFYAVYPWYNQYCGAHKAMVTPTQGNYYYLVPTEANVCNGYVGKMGYGSGAGYLCPNQKDAALFPRTAGISSISDAKVGLAINDESAGYYRNFTLKSMYVHTGPVVIYGMKNPGGTWVSWGPVGAGNWNFNNSDNLGQVQIKSSNGSGQFRVDNINIVAN